VPGPCFLHNLWKISSRRPNYSLAFRAPFATPFAVFTNAARADNAERALWAMADSVRDATSPNYAAAELDKIEQFLGAASPAFRALRFEPFSAAGGFGVAPTAPAAAGAAAGAASADASAWWAGAAAPPAWSSFMPLEDILAPASAAAWGPGWADVTVVSLQLPPAPAHGVFAFVCAAGRPESGTRVWLRRNRGVNRDHRNHIIRSQPCK
jgi:hypothetical protein